MRTKSSAKPQSLPSFFDLVKQGFSILRQHSRLFFTLVLIGYLPTLLMNLLLQANVIEQPNLDPMGPVGTVETISWLENGGQYKIWGISIINFVFACWYMFITAVITYAAGLYLTNKKKFYSMSISQLINEVGAKLFAILGTNRVTSVAVVFLLLLLIIPGVIYAIYWTFVEEVVLFTNLNGVDAMKRSKELVTGRWWKIFWYVVGFICTSTVIIALVNWTQTEMMVLLPGSIFYLSGLLNIIPQFLVVALVISRVSLYFSLNEMGRSK